MQNPHSSILRPLFFASIVALLGGISASAQDLVISGTVSSSIQTTYTPSEFSYPAILQMGSTVSVPGTINPAGDSGHVDLEFAAPAGEQINITPDSSGDDLYIAAYYVANSDAGLSLNGPVTVTFTGLVGTAPTFTTGGSFFGYSFGDEALDLDFNATSLSNFSFTGVEFSFPVSGTGNNVQLSQSGSAEIQVSNDNYSGGTPPNNPQLISVTQSVPEPSTFALLGFGAVSLPCLRRFVRRRG
jgi:hypothetical protein